MARTEGDGQPSAQSPMCAPFPLPGSKVSRGRAGKDRAFLALEPPQSIPSASVDTMAKVKHSGFVYCALYTTKSR